MLAGRAAQTILPGCRAYASVHGFKPVPILPDSSLETFRTQAFEPATPALLPRHAFDGLPAVRKWFIHGNKTSNGTATLNRTYLARFGSTMVPLEISNNDQFNRIEQSLSFFLECVRASNSTYHPRPSRYFSAYVPNARAIKRTVESNDFFSAATITPPTARIYLAQAPINDLPQALRDDLPTPELVLKAGKGDVYDSSIWIGQAPTYTPLHRDPNPNLFVQLAGRKMVRLFRPEIGRTIFAKVQEKIGGSASATIRGEEMMQGVEKKALEEEVWGDDAPQASAWQAELGSGDGLFIPKGWWHSIKGVGHGMTGSPNHGTLGFESTVFNFNPAEPEQSFKDLEEKLELGEWDAIAIGWGFRGFRQFDEQFEKTINMLRWAASEAMLLFHYEPDGVSEAIRRNFNFGD